MNKRKTYTTISSEWVFDEIVPSLLIRHAKDFASLKIPSPRLQLFLL